MRTFQASAIRARCVSVGAASLTSTLPISGSGNSAKTRRLRRWRSMLDKQSVINALERHLGKDLAFLAPSIGTAMFDVVQSGVQAGLAPYRERARQQEQAQYNGKLDALRAKM